MEQRTRSILLGAGALIAVVLIGVWWWSGFTLDFMRFFAAETDLQRSIEPLPPLRTEIAPRQSLGPGCYLQQVQCIQEPCDPIIVCPSGASDIVSCSPTTQTVQVGSGARLSATGGNGTTYSWFAPQGTIAMPDVSGDFVWKDFLVNYSTPGTKKVTVQAPRGDGIHTDSVACTVIVTP
jgi:hypothetical protein